MARLHNVSRGEIEGRPDGFQHMMNVKFETSELEMFQHTSEKLKVYEVESDRIPHSVLGRKFL